jgi:hypothetical protein
MSGGCALDGPSNKMEDIQELVVGLTNEDHNYAYQCLNRLESVCISSNAVYAYFTTLVEMLDDPNSYFRTRAIILIAANAKWDQDGRIDEIIDQYLMHIMDAKPITARQCVKALPIIAKYKPDLVDCICSALRQANPKCYKGSMESLVRKDIQEALKSIEAHKSRFWGGP